MRLFQTVPSQLSMMRGIILIAFIGAALAAPQPEVQPVMVHTKTPRVIGGEDTTIQTYPYMSNMQYHWLGILWSAFCGGSLITPSTILSAAHCFLGDQPSQWRVRLGSTFVSSGGVIHPVSRIIIHESYNPNTLDSDVAIIHLSTQATLSESIGLARIAGPNYILADGTDVSVIGWGSTGSGSPDILQRVTVHTINQQLCAERYAYLKTQPGFQGWPDITDTMLCSGILDIGGKDACQGDSGGPVAHQGDILVGITSWGYQCAHPEYPGVNARVSSFTDWIVQHGSG